MEELELITVYSKPSCQQCKATERALTRSEVPYVLSPLDDDALALVERMGLGRTAPVVVVSHPETGKVIDAWTGYNPGKLRGLDHTPRT